jgi:hypothetical protein
MFLKRCDRRKGGKKHTYCVLVESYRTARGSRHRIVASPVVGCDRDDLSVYPEHLTVREEFSMGLQHLLRKGNRRVHEIFRLSFCVAHRLAARAQ